MVNYERIVPITKIDLLSLIGTVMTLNNTSFAVLPAKTITGEFEVTGTGAAGNKLANQPVKTCDFVSGVTSGTVYFVPAYDFVGFKVAGAAVDPYTGSVDEIKPDGVTLYKAVLASGHVTVTAVTPELV